VPVAPPEPQPPFRRKPTVVLPVLGEAAAVTPIQAALPDESDPLESDQLRRVRELLIESLRLDAPVFSARTFMRVRAAQTATELIDLTWEIENHLVRARHTRRELITLQRARELLGMGNTLVADDSTRPPHLD